jgi:hypothetical protein
MDSNIVGYRYGAKFNNPLRQTSDISFSTQGSPAMGEAQTATFKVKNTSADSITVDMGLADEVASAKQWESFPLKETLTFTPGEEKELSYTKTIKYAGSHRIWASFRFNGVWYDLLPNSTQTVKYGMWVHLPDIRVLGISLDQSPTAYIDFQIYLTIKNYESRPITLSEIKIFGFKENNQQYKYTLFLPDHLTKDIVINSNEIKSYTASKSLDEEGYYWTWPSYTIGSLNYDIFKEGWNPASIRYYVTKIGIIN